MTKSDLIEKLASVGKIKNRQAEEVVNLIFTAMTETLVKGGRIEIRGFGSFVCRHHSAYEGRNPRTGKTIHVAEKRQAFFKVGKEMKERVDAWGT